MATFKKPESIIATAGCCPGCGHGIVQRLIAESIEELGLQDGVLASVDIACAFWSEDAMDYAKLEGAKEVEFHDDRDEIDIYY